MGHTKLSIGSNPMCHAVAKEKQNPHKGQQQSGNIHRCSVHVAYENRRACKFDDGAPGFIAQSEPSARQVIARAKPLTGEPHLIFKAS
jgi:hypothetical protein